MTKLIRFLILFGITILHLTSCIDSNKNKTNIKPNIIFILADDLGYGDLSCYGQEKFQTPNLDHLASEGLRFTQHYSGSTVCAPSRSVLMTGQHTGHTFIRGNRGFGEEGQFPLIKNAYTIAELLKDNGYVTGAFGKWGLGSPGSDGDPMYQGFDRFYGYNCQSLAHNYYPRHLWDNLEKVIIEVNKDSNEGVYAPFLIQEKALEFIEQNKDTAFFMFVPSIIPHAELFAPEEYIAKYRSKYLPEKEYFGVDDGPRFRNGAYGSQPESHAAFLAMIEILDQQVGEIVNKVKELGLEKNTIILFSSDNGPHLEGGADPDYFNSNGPLRGYKRDLYEGGIRVPFIVWWPGHIEPGTESDHISAFWDMYPTFAELSGAELPDSIDGISLMPTLTGKGLQLQHEYLYWEFHERKGRIAVRKGNWKGVRYNVKTDPDSPLELYDLSKDIEEQDNVTEDYPEIVKEIESIFKKARTESEHFRF